MTQTTYCVISEDINEDFVLNLDLKGGIRKIKRRKKTKEKAESKRFAAPKTDEEVNIFASDPFSGSTCAKYKWAVNLFEVWLNERNSKADFKSEMRVISGDLVNMDNATLSYSLSCFVTEVRKCNGEEYCGNSLYKLVMCIQHFKTAETHFKFVK